MVDVTVASFEEMEPIYEGIARRARADDEAFELRPGMMIRVGPEQLRRIVPSVRRECGRRQSRRGVHPA